MISLIFIAVFVLCAAIVVANILVSQELTNAYESRLLEHHFYYLLAYYAFAMYGIWGQIVVRALLSSFEGTIAGTDTVPSLITLLGVPFLFVSWLMLLNMAYSITGATATSAHMLVHVALLLLASLGSWLVFRIVTPSPELLASAFRQVEAGVVIGLEGLYFAGFLAIVLRSRGKLEQKARAGLMRFAGLMVGAFLLRSIALPFALSYPSLVSIAVLICFASNSFPLFYLRLNADRMFEPVKAERTTDERMKLVVEKYGITKREREIIKRVCEGKTNQQIADAMFISLQTVKDHTHRIYSKMGISSRVQLVQRLNA